MINAIIFLSLTVVSMFILAGILVYQEKHAAE